MGSNSITLRRCTTPGKPSEDRDNSYIGLAQNYPTKPHVRYIQKAKMWCKTYFENAKRGAHSRVVMTQRQAWSLEKPEEV